MPQTYFSIVTDLGKNKIAAALAGGTTIILEEIAVGDGSGNPTTPDPTQTALVNEVHRANLSELKVDPVNPNYILSQIVIPTNIGGWTIRELGLFDEDGDLIAVANYPDSYKPLITEGAGREMIIRLIIMIEDGEDEAFELVIDPGVALATQQWVEAGYSFGAQVPGGKAGMNLRKSSDADGAVEWYAPFNRGSLPGVAIGFDGYGDTGIDPAPFVEDPFAFYFRGVVSDVTAGEGGSNVLGNTRGVAGFPSGTFSLIVNDDGDIKFYNERGGSDPANNIIAPATVNVPNGTPFECIMLVNPVNETIDFYVNGFNPRPRAGGDSSTHNWMIF